MSKVDNGGPAFPRQANMTNGGSAGMTMRDYFAAKAMAALIYTSGGPCIVGGLSVAEPETAKAAYNFADAMLAERDKAR